MVDCEIVSFTRSEKEMHGDKLRLGFFTCDLPGVRLIGCGLIRKADGGIVVYSPMPVGRDLVKAGVEIRNADLRRNLTEKALAAYRALGGTSDSQKARRTIGVDGWPIEQEIKVRRLAIPDIENGDDHHG